jgi:23S rRNA (cytosine1962-C5)-methyltransferase
VGVRGAPEGPIRISQRTPAGSVDFLADPWKGQKTGFYFDQRENRNRLHDYCEGKSVLDCFSSTGGFGVTAAECGAREVLSVDSGEGVCELLERNYALNGFKADVVREDAALVLRRFREERRKFDIIVLDPPALAKSKKNLFGALRKYQELNELAMGLLPSGGILFSCSCSHHVSRDAFSAMLGKAAMAEARGMRILEVRGQSRDHPVLPSMPETEYLKCVIAEIL